MVEDRWTQKLTALLHDPPHKAWVLGTRVSHGALARELQELALGRVASREEQERAERADRIAAAADRLNLPKGTEAYWTQVEAVLKHPLSGGKLDLGRFAEDPRELQERVREIVEGLLKGEEEPEGRYLRLWRLLGDRLSHQLPKLGPLTLVSPADTRQPDHALLHHLTMTAAIADALPRPAFLVFSVGPVQGFIAAARRTQDLWTGSWLLSYLAWRAMEALADEFGPDAIVYPSLRGQPLCDVWLIERKGVPVERPTAAALSLASLPNKFVALLPAEEAERAAERAERAVLEAWERLAEAVYSAVEGFAPVDAMTREIWASQISAHWELYWTILPWMGADRPRGKEQAEAVMARYEALLGPPEEFRRVYEALERSGQYDANWGTVYSLLYDLADRAFNARKALRAFPPAEERGEKCTVCGQRAALRARALPAKDFWREAAQRRAERNRYDLKPEGRERLCAVCAVKRFAHEEVLRREFDLHVGFPSTSEVAAAPFKARALEKLRLGDREVERALRAYLDWLERQGVPRTVAPGALPSLEARAGELSGERRELARRLLGFDGEFFLIDTLTPQRLQEAVPGLAKTADQAAQAVQEGRRLLSELHRALGGGPTKYYALLLMDGDHMGRWLSGTHKELPSFGELLHPKVRKKLEQHREWRDVLGAKRLLTPALHATVSSALADFSLKLVRWIVEERHKGRVVYAGGDDVLALLPLEDALSAARELRAVFSGEAELREGDLIVKFQDDQDEKISGYLTWKEKDRLLLTLGPRATASVGLAVAHHLHPLDLVLQAARRAERAAKEHYDRNALAVEVLKRSGETLAAGTRWMCKSLRRDSDPVRILLDVYERLRDGRLSMRFPQTVALEAPTLAGLPPEAQQAELSRLLRRQAGEGLSSKNKKRQARELGETLVALAQALGEPRPGSAEAPTKSGVERLADWLLVCAFLARGGEA